METDDGAADVSCGTSVVDDGMRSLVGVTDGVGSGESTGTDECALAFAEPASWPDCMTTPVTPAETPITTTAPMTLQMTAFFDTKTPQAENDKEQDSSKLLPKSY